jgi:ribosomal protein S18 acetylase RimI-like enzyme
VGITVAAAREATDELVVALTQLLPQLTGAPSTIQPTDVAAILADPGARLLVARDDDGRIVGTATVSTYRTPTRRRAHIDDVVVDDRARGHGIGAALTAEAIRIAAELGAEQVDLTSAPSREAANRLYQRLGFEQRTTNVYRLDLKPRRTPHQLR